MSLPSQESPRALTIAENVAFRGPALASIVRLVHNAGMADEPRIAVFIDYENLAIGASQMGGGGLEISLALKRLLEKGRIVFKRAYCDWSQLPLLRCGSSTRTVSSSSIYRAAG